MLTLMTLTLFGQERVGINTTTPQRMLHVSGTSNQYLRIHSTPAVGSEAGLELIRGASNVSSGDWRIVNSGGILKYLYSTNNFTTAGEEIMRTYGTNLTGIGTSSPYSKLHVEGGGQFVFGGYGFLKIGSHTSNNIAFDNHQLRAYDNGLPAPLILQGSGGDTYFNNSGDNVYLADGGGRVGIGVTALDALVNVESTGFHLALKNATDGDNNAWYIGASNASWAAGDNQLLFSPTSSSNDAVLRLLNQNENDGTNAPVMIYTTADHTLLLDGNEIDTRNTPLYINHNSDENTYLNHNAGRVGIGTTSPDAIVDVVVSGDTKALALQRDNTIRHFSPWAGLAGSLGLYNAVDNDPYAYVSSYSGTWGQISDREKKTNIQPLTNALDSVMKMKLYSYNFKNDPEKRKSFGAIAQEVETIFPEIVHVTNGQYGMAYSQLAAVGLAAIREQQTLIDELKMKIEAFRKQMADAHPESSTAIIENLSKN